MPPQTRRWPIRGTAIAVTTTTLFSKKPHRPWTPGSNSRQIKEITLAEDTLTYTYERGARWAGDLVEVPFDVQ